MGRFAWTTMLLLLGLLLLAAGAAQAGIITSRLYGSFGYLDQDGAHHPSADMRFEVWRPDHDPSGLYPGEDELVASGELDANGFFDLYVQWDFVVPAYPFTETSTLIVKLLAKSTSPSVDIINPDSGRTYAWDLYANWNSGHTLGLFGTNTPGSEDGHFVAHLYSQTRDAQAAVAANWGDDIGGIRIRYPKATAPTGGIYNTYGSIELPAYSQWRDDHLFRLLGHRWHDQFGSLVDHDLCDGTCDDTASICSFCDWCEESELAAWNEGVALFFADQVTTWLLAEGQEPSLQLHDFETLNLCEGTTYGDPLLTPGNTAALLLDLVDPVSTSDYNPEYQHFDSISGLATHVRYVITTAAPTGTLDFLANLHALLPTYSKDIWSTAMGNGFDSDAWNPGVVENFVSPSHPVNSWLPDNTVDFTWDPAWDDASGIQGYAIEITDTSVRPPEALTVGPVTSWTTPPLAPGTYYMNILALDWSGRWATLTYSYGPFNITDASELDLVYEVLPGWDFVSFPSQGETNTNASAHVTALMEGNVVPTHWNLAFENLGPATTGTVYIHAFVDDEPESINMLWNNLPSGTSRSAVDQASFTVRGGRHNFHTMLDGRDDNTETNEANNIHGRQFVWSGLPLTAGTPLTRAAPPYWWAGADKATNASWYTCDGLSFDSTPWWSAVAVRPLSDVDNYACRLHQRSTGSDDGFTANEAYSARPAGTLDAVIVNRTLVDNTAWDVGVLNPASGGADYRVVFEPVSSMSFGDSLDITFAADRLLLLREIAFGFADTGLVTVTVDIGDAPDPITVLWLDDSFTTGTLLDFDVAATTGIDGKARLNFHVPDIGFYGLVLYRDAYDVTDPVNIVLEVSTTPADLTPYLATGWHAPMVPRPTDDGTITAVAAPDSLVGNEPSTYFNFASINQGYLAATPAHIGAELDGAPLFGITYPTMPAGVPYRTNNHNPFTVRGGRHTLALIADAPDWVEEMDETNNTFGTQYVWSPLVVPLGTGTDRGPLPNPVGNWEQAGTAWFNCDGLRLPEPAPADFWTALIAMPKSIYDDPNVRMHTLSTGVTDGFGLNLGASNWGPGESDYVLVNANLAGQAALDVGIVQGAGGSDEGFRVEAVAAPYMGLLGAGTTGPFTCLADETLDIYEFSINPGIHHLVLENVTGDVDWGLSVHPQDEAYLTKSDVLDGGSAWHQGPGQNEYLTFEVTETNYYCVAVWKRRWSDLPLSGAYNLRVVSDVSGVEDPSQGVPRATILTGAAPNPFNPQTSINYELARPGRVRLAIHDLTGARVADLVNEIRTAGSHHAVWTGLDKAGRQVASGVYMARLTVDGHHVGMTKLSLLK